MDLWLKEIDPINDLRECSVMILEGVEVQERYFRKLNNKREPVEIIVRKAREGYVVQCYFRCQR